MRIAAIQTDIQWNDPHANVLRARALAERAAQGGAELVVFPEMFTTGFSFAEGQAAREAGEAGAELLQDLAAQYGIVCAGSIPRVASSQRCLNSFECYDSHGLLGAYSKTHLFSIGGESERYDAGGGLVHLDLKGLGISLFVCYDLRFGEAFSVLAQKTHLYVVTANWPAARRHHWDVLIQARAVENQAYVLGVNRVGSGGGIEYAGGSMLCSPQGDILARAGAGEEVVTGEVWPEVVARYRAEFPVLRDRRPELYHKAATGADS